MTTTITIQIDPNGSVTMTSQASLLETSSTIYSKRTTLTTTPVALGSSIQDLTELILQAHPDNTENIEIGSDTDQSWVMPPTDTFKCPIRNPAMLWGKSVSGTQYVNLMGRKGT